MVDWFFFVSPVIPTSFLQTNGLQNVLYTGPNGKGHADELEGGYNTQEKVLGVLRGFSSQLPTRVVYIHVFGPQMRPMWKRTTSSKGHRWQLPHPAAHHLLLSAQRFKESKKIYLRGLASLSPSPAPFQRGVCRREKRSWLSLWSKVRAWGLRRQLWTGFSKLRASNRHAAMSWVAK